MERKDYFAIFAQCLKTQLKNLYAFLGYEFITQRKMLRTS